MKKFKFSTVATIAVYAMLMVVLSSCNEQDVCNYNGKQIVEKARATAYRSFWFRFRKDGEITGRVYVVEYDWNKYNVGDTLYCR